MSEDVFPVRFFLIIAFLFGATFGWSLSATLEGRQSRDKFIAFCTSQNVPYEKCKDEWEKP